MIIKKSKTMKYKQEKEKKKKKKKEIKIRKTKTFLDNDNNNPIILNTFAEKSEIKEFQSSRKLRKVNNIIKKSVFLFGFK